MARKDFALTPAQKIDTREALTLLEGTGITLVESVKYRLAGTRVVKKKKLSDAVDAFLADRHRSGVRQGTLDWYFDKLDVFVGKFGDRSMDEIGRLEIADWIQNRSVAASTQNGYARTLRALWRWALRYDPPMVGADVTMGLVKAARTREKEIQYLSVDECSKIMAGAGRYRSTLALMLFAGIRPNEVAGRHKDFLRWEHINTVEKIIRVPAAQSKIGHTRNIEGLPATIWAWLQPGASGDDISSALSREPVSCAARLANYGGKRPWPKDALRHTFATYHVAALSDPGKTALLLGHEGDQSVLYRHYRGLATKAEAEKFWALRPS